MLLLAALFGILVGFARGGTILALGHLKFRGWLLYFLGFVAQIFILRYSFLLKSSTESLIYCGSFALLLWGSYLDRLMQGMPWIGGGLAANSLAIIFNGGKMPVRAGLAIVAKGGRQGLTHVSMAQSARLWFLGDVFRIPVTASHYVLVSPGDLLIATGVFILVQGVMRWTPKGAA